MMKMDRGKHFISSLNTGVHMVRTEHQMHTQRCMAALESYPKGLLKCSPSADMPSVRCLPSR